MFPKPLLLISFEPASHGGARSVRRIPGVKVLRIRYDVSARERRECPELLTFDEGMELISELEGDEYFVTHVIDTATSLQEVALEKAIGGAAPVQNAFGAIGRDVYMERSDLTKRVLKGLLNLPVSTITLAQQKDVNEYKEGLDPFFHCALGDSPGQWLSDATDLIHLSLAKEMEKKIRVIRAPGKPKEIKEVMKETGRFVRRLCLLPSDKFAAGIRGEDPDSIPEYVEARTPKGLYEALIDVIEGRRKGAAQ